MYLVYFPIDVHDTVEILSPPFKGHTGNKNESYIYGRKTFIIQRKFHILGQYYLPQEGWLPVNCLH